MDANTCSTPVCGDGKKEGSEGCDDGNVKSGDGCSETCTVEKYYGCCKKSFFTGKMGWVDGSGKDVKELCDPKGLTKVLTTISSLFAGEKEDPHSKLFIFGPVTSPLELLKLQGEASKAQELHCPGSVKKSV
jgi:cysteine-rich repeat protein